MSHRNWLHPRVAFKTLLCRVFRFGEFCNDCGVRQQLVWRAPDPLWKRVSGSRDGEGILCPNCFTKRAVWLDIWLRWMPTEDVP
jgi:hypothetical protein